MKQGKFRRVAGGWKKGVEKGSRTGHDGGVKGASNKAKNWSGKGPGNLGGARKKGIGKKTREGNCNPKKRNSALIRIKGRGRIKKNHVKEEKPPI